MDKYELLLHDIKAILEAVGEVNKVSHGKAIPIADEDIVSVNWILYLLFRRKTAISNL